MRIVEKQPVRIVGRYVVMEGCVERPDCDNGNFCWVEDEHGIMVSEFVDRDLAMGIAETLAGEAGTGVEEPDDLDEPAPRWIQ